MIQPKPEHPSITVHGRNLIRGRWHRPLCAPLLLWATCLLPLAAGSIPLDNPSFESPAVTYISTIVPGWQKPSKPDDYIEGGGFTWDQLTGIFKNLPVTDSDHLGNCDGDQALWLFAVPKVGIYQELDGITSTAPPASYEPGTAYGATLAALGGGGNMLAGATLEFSLFYRDDASNQVVVASTTITNYPRAAGTPKALADYSIATPPVSPTDPWAARPIGLRVLSTVAPSLQGGYWDIDHVRLRTLIQPAFTEVSYSDGAVALTLQSEPGRTLEILASTNLAASVSDWTRVATLSNALGTVTFTEPTSDNVQRYFRARELDDQ